MQLKYLRMPNFIRGHPDLSPREKIILSCVYSFIIAYGSCGATNGFFAQGLGCHENKITEAISKARDLKLFVIHEKKNGKKVILRKITLHPTITDDGKDLIVDGLLLKKHRIEWTNIIVLSELLELCVNEGYSWISNKELAERSNLSERQVQRILADFGKLGIIINHLPSNNSAERQLFINISALYNFYTECPYGQNDMGVRHIGFHRHDILGEGGTTYWVLRHDILGGDNNYNKELHNNNIIKKNSPFPENRYNVPPSLSLKELDLLKNSTLAFIIARLNIHTYNNPELEHNLSHLLSQGYSKEDIIKVIKLVSKANREDEAGSLSELDPKDPVTYELEIFTDLYDGYINKDVYYDEYDLDDLPF